MRIYLIAIVLLLLKTTFAQQPQSFIHIDQPLLSTIEKNKLESKLQSFHDSCNYTIKIQAFDKVKYPMRFDAHSLLSRMTLKEYTTYLLVNDKNLNEEGVLIVIDTIQKKAAIAFASNIINPQISEDWIVNNIEISLQRGSLYKSLDKVIDKLIFEMNCRNKETASKQKLITNIIGPTIAVVVVSGLAALCIWMVLLK